MTTQQFQQLGITFPITTEFWQMAQHFAEQCPFPEKAPQIRHNTLAVCAVNAYLQLMNVPTRLAESDSWNPMMQMMADACDLQVPQWGALECRPVMVGETVCHVPPEAWHERAGYVAVMLDEENSRATLVGFVRTVAEQTQIALEIFLPMEALLDDIYERSAEAVESVNSQPDKQTNNQTVAEVGRVAIASYTHLGNWLEGTVSAGWQAVEDLLRPANMNLAFRSTTSLSETRSAADISRARPINLEVQPGKLIQLALVIHLAQVNYPFNDQANDQASARITVQVHPLGISPYLPDGLELSIFDEQGSALFPPATSRAIDNYLQFQLAGQPEERFSIRISLAEAAFEEQFVI